MLFDNWAGIIRVIVLGACAYIALIAILRVSGKRTLAKMNAFDLVVTVGLGSTLATVLLSKDVALAEGVVAFLVLVALQYATAALSVRFQPFEAIAKSEPVALLRNGTIDEDALLRERVTRSEVLSAIRSAGFGSLAPVAAVVLETDGMFSVVSKAKAGDGTALPTLGETRT